MDRVDGQNEADSATVERDDDTARSEENILRWMQYLPQDCIETMIRLGWDIST